MVLASGTSTQLMLARPPKDETNRNTNIPGFLTVPNWNLWMYTGTFKNISTGTSTLSISVYFSRTGPLSEVDTYYKMSGSQESPIRCYSALVILLRGTTSTFFFSVCNWDMRLTSASILRLDFDFRLERLRFFKDRRYLDGRPDISLFISFWISKM